MAMSTLDRADDASAGRESPDVTRGITTMPIDLPRQDLILPPGLSRRRFLSGVGVMGAGAVILSACGGSDSSASSSSAAGDASSSGTEVFKVGFAYVGPTSDNGWTFTHDEARLAVEAAYPNVETTFVENVPFSAEATQIFDELAQNNDMVIVNSEYADLLGEAVSRNPDTFFLECNGRNFGPNIGAYYINHHKVAYAMGIAAGHMTENGQLGYIGAFPTATVFNDTNCFLLGARTVRPEASLKVIMISSFFDPPAATQAANALIDGGADVIFDVQDETSALQVAQERGAFSAIWNRDNREFGPEAFINAIDLKWQDYYIDQVGRAIEGSWTPPAQADLLDLGAGVDLAATWGSSVTQEAQDAGDAARQAMLDGFEPYTGPISDASGAVRLEEGQSLTDQEVYLVDWSIDGVSGVL